MPWPAGHPHGKENGAPVQPPQAHGLSETSSGHSLSQGASGRSFKRERSEGLAALLDSTELSAARPNPYSLRRQLTAAKPMSQREPSLAHLAASNSADLGTVHHAVASARSQQQSGPSKVSQNAKAEDTSPRRGSHPQVQQPFNGFATANAGGGQQPQPAATDQAKFLSPFSQQFAGLDPLDAFAHLPEGLRIQLQAPGGEDMSRANSIVYNQVTSSCLIFHTTDGKAGRLHTLQALIFCGQSITGCTELTCAGRCMG